MSTKYLGYFEKDERILVEVIAGSTIDAMRKLKLIGAESKILKGYKLDASMVYPCGTFYDLSPNDRHKMLMHGFLIGRNTDD